MFKAQISGEMSFAQPKFLTKSYVILISGKMGVGKSTGARLLVEMLANADYNSSIECFAQGVKDSAFSCFGWDGNKDTGGRKLLQDIGNAGRKYNENIWVSQLVNRIESNLYSFDVYIVDDWRFPNEKIFLENTNMFEILTIRLESMIRGDYLNEDISETSLPSNDVTYYDFIIYNDGSIEELREKLYTIVETIEKLEE